MIYYKPEHFEVKELVPKALYNLYGEDCLKFFDPRILFSADMIRKRYNKTMIINNWHLGGVLENRGFRMPDCKTGAFLSDHKFGRAIDANISGITPEEIRVDILSNPSDEAFKYITCIEMQVSWLHISCRNRMKITDNIELIYPYNSKTKGV